MCLSVIIKVRMEGHAGPERGKQAFPVFFSSVLGGGEIGRMIWRNREYVALFLGEGTRKLWTLRAHTVE